MSLWISRRDRRNRQQLWQIDVPVEFVLLIAGLLLSLFLLAAQRASTQLAMAAGLITLTGLILLVLCKLTLFRRGILISWGSSRMSRCCATLYRIAYGLLFVGLGFFALVAMLAV